MKVGDLVRIERVPIGQGMDSLVGQTGIVLPTPSWPESWDHYVNVYVNEGTQVMYRANIEVVNENR